MAVTQVWHYVCPITGTQAETLNGERPLGWFSLNAEDYAPESMAVMAARVARGITDPAQLVAPFGTVSGDEV